MQRDHSRTPRGAAATTTLGTEEIASLVFQREQARHGKDWAEADRVRDELRAAGVTCWDKKQQWECTDGRKGAIPSFADVEAGVMPPIQDGFQGASAESYQGGEAEVQIRQQVAAREAARASKNFAESDRIRDELNANGVKIYDKEKIWKQESTGLMGCVLGYAQSGPTDIEIRTLVLEREKARNDKDYAKSDIIRDDLKRFGVEIRDKEKIWKGPNGRSGPVPSFADITNGNARNVAFGQAGQVAAAPAAGLDLQQTILATAALGAQNPGVAQQTLQLLAQLATLLPGQTQQPVAGLGMQPPPVQQRGSGIIKAAGSAGKGGAMAREALDYVRKLTASGQMVSADSIQWVVDARERVRFHKDWASSDAIRDALRGTLGVNLYEKEKRWQASNGFTGSIKSFAELGLA